MQLTLNQFLFLILTFAAVIAIIFIVVFLNQMRRTAKEGEKTLIEIRTLVGNLQETTTKVDSKLDDLEEILQASKKTAQSLAEATWTITTKAIRPSSKYWPYILPLIRFGWQHFKKRKEK